MLVTTDFLLDTNTDSSVLEITTRPEGDFFNADFIVTAYEDDDDY